VVGYNFGGRRKGGLIMVMSFEGEEGGSLQERDIGKKSKKSR